MSARSNWQVAEAAKRGDVAYMIDALTDTNPDVRRTAARRLGHTGDPAAVEPLGRLLRASDDGLKIIAAKALKRIGDPNAIPQLYELATAKDVDAGPRLTAMDALGELGDPRAVELLATVVGDKTLNCAPGFSRPNARQYRQWAAKRLTELDGVAAIEVLEEAARQASSRRERWTHLRAIKALRSSTSVG